MKIYFWLKERMYRIILWTIIVFFSLAELGRTGGYLDALIMLGFLWSIQGLGAVAFAEKAIYLDRKLAKEIADRLEMK